jgi:hypothetical protein
MDEKIYGFDFDGVIGNTPRLKIEMASQLFNAHVEMKNCYRQGFLDAGMTENEYASLQRMIENGEYAPRIVQGCKGYFQDMLAEGIKSRIVSYRIKKGEKIIKDILVRNDMYDKRLVEIVCTDSQPKSKFCGGLLMFVDDRIEHLIGLKGYVKNRRLFDALYNRDEKLSDGIKRVYGWKETVEKILKIG